jgi:hypothetical protein
MEFPNIARVVGLSKPFAWALVAVQGQPGGPIIVNITETPKSELSTLSEVLLGSLGLSGLLALMAILLGIAVGALMFWIKRRSMN